MLTLDKVLHVEDERNVRFMVRHYFGGEWARIDEADTVRAGLELIENNGNGYQLIILDLGLPDGEGIETIRTFRACTVAPIVIYSGLQGPVIEEIEQNAKQLGVYGVIRKGITFSEDRIRAFIENAVRTWREERYAKTLREIADQIDGITLHRRKVINELRG